MRLKTKFINSIGRHQSLYNDMENYAYFRVKGQYPRLSSLALGDIMFNLDFMFPCDSYTSREEIGDLTINRTVT
jgi:hypothetical protein